MPEITEGHNAADAATPGDATQQAAADAQADEGQSLWDEIVNQVGDGDGDGDGVPLPGERAAADPPAGAAPPPDPPQEPPAPAAPAGGPPAAPAAPAPAPAAPAPAAPTGADPSLIEVVRSMEAQLKTVAGRVSAMQGAFDKLKPGDAKPTERQVADAAKSPEKWQRFQSDFPEFAEALEERVGMLGRPADADADAVQRIVDERLSRAAAEREAEIEAEIEEVHAGWKSMVNTPEFVDWISNHADENSRQVAASSRSPLRISKMLDKHKAWLQSRTSAPASAAAPSTAPSIDLAAAVIPKGGRTVPRPSPDDLDGEQLWNHLASKEQVGV